jgi:hypothetical protein
MEHSKLLENRDSFESHLPAGRQGAHCDISQRKTKILGVTLIDQSWVFVLVLEKNASGKGQKPLL